MFLAETVFAVTLAGLALGRLGLKMTGGRCGLGILGGLEPSWAENDRRLYREGPGGRSFVFLGLFFLAEAVLAFWAAEAISFWAVLG